MENNIRVFIRSVIILLITFISLQVLFNLAYAYSSINMYNAILIVIIVAINFCILAMTLMCVAIIHTYRSKRFSFFFLKVTKLGLKILLPAVLVITKVNNNAKKSIRNFYIELNNIVVEADNKKYKAEETMLLLPHCLQNGDCGLKVTSNASLCRRCGKCKIGVLLDYTEQKKIEMFIATGGTVARNIIKKKKPKLILSVACERDLMSGIADVSGVPVIGITNRQPNGPCFNTDVDIEAIIKRVEQLIV